MAAFILPSATPLLSSLASSPSHARLRRPSTSRSAASQPPRIRMSSQPPSKRPNWSQIALVITATTTASIFPTFTKTTSLNRIQLVQAATTAAPTQRTSLSDPISLKALGIKRDQFLSERELRRRKTTQLSETEQEIMELEEWDAQTESFRGMQAIWAAVISIGGIFLLYRGGVMWENWIKEQERKDMEEEIKLTGTFIDPRAVRKDEDKRDSTNTKKKPKDSGPSSGPPSAPPTDPSDGDKPPGGIDSLEKLFGQS